ncbi:MAG: Gfo/Idh/MocA family oxidoreductase [Verrucomicrobiae bacterium]|nr:Gfo/Idh/MocA family oxidoreductase [Verrucomicrobiae bacterium]
MKPIRYVLLGGGGIAGNHHSQAVKLPGVTLAGVHDTSEATMERWKNNNPSIAVSADAKKLLSLTKPDLAIVCSPNAAHCPLTLAALQAGCHVLCEKPLAMDLGEALKMEAARKKARRLGGINFSYRYVPSFRLAREIIRNGELGKIQRLNIKYLQSWIASPHQHYSWRNDIKVAGFGALGDLGVHMLDAAAYLTDLEPAKLAGVAQTLIPVKNDAQGKSHKVTTDTNASFLIQYAGGALGVFETSQVAVGFGNYFHVEISGDKGVLRVLSEDGDNITLYSSQTVSQYDTWNAESFPKVRIPSGFAGLQSKNAIEGMVNTLRGVPVNNDYPTFEDGIRAQRCLTAIGESMKTDRWIRV